MNERMQAFKRTRGYHLRNHGGPLRICSEVVCQSRITRLKSRRQPWTIAPYEKGGTKHALRAALLAGTGDR